MRLKNLVAVGAVLNLGMGIGAAFAGTQGLVIHTSEFGVGKFHRFDNQLHPYPQSSAWKDYVLPENAEFKSGAGPLTVDNADGSVTIFYSTLDQMLAQVVELSQKRHEPVRVLNVHGHGLPGGMWFPATADDLNGMDCGDWVSAASGRDQDNYDQYYSPVSYEEIQEVRAMGNISASMGCTTGLNEWKAAVAKLPAIRTVFADDAQVHFLSCVVGLGKTGQAFTQGVGALILGATRSGRVETSIDFGLGDWSMPQGMGFWDYQNDSQLAHDNEVYPKDRQDSELAQKGTIRMVTGQGEKWSSTLLSGRDFMAIGFENGVEGTVMPELTPDRWLGFHPAAGVSHPARIRVPGTTVYVRVK